MLGSLNFFVAFSALLFVVALTTVHADETDLLTPIRELDPAKHRSELRKALFGGSPSIIICQPARTKKKTQKKTKGKKKNTKDAAVATESLGGAELDSYVSQVQRKLGGAAVQIVVSECHKSLGGNSSKSVLKALRLVEKPGLPTVVWSAHGDKPLQLTHEQLATTIKGKDGKPTGQARLDAGRLAQYASKNARPRVNVVKSALDFQNKCLSLKHQRCALFMHAGALSADAKKAFKSLAGDHRDYRFMAADTTSFAFSIANKLPKVTAAQPRLVVFQRRVKELPFAMVTRGQQALPDISHDQKKDADNSTCTDSTFDGDATEVCNEDKQVDEKRHVVSVSKSLGDLIKLSSNASVEAIHAVFEKNVLDSHRDYNKLHAQSTAPGQLTPEQRKDLVFKISVKASSDIHEQVDTKRVAYLLDWTAMESYFVSHTVYGKGLNIGKLALLQQDTWKRVHERQNSLAKKSLAVNAKAFREDGLVLAKGQSEASQFLKDIAKGKLKPLPLSKVPVLKSTKKVSPAKTSTKKAAGGGKSSSYKSKKTSGSNTVKTKVKPPSRKERERKAKGKKGGRGSSSGGLSAEQVELERQHRLEMDREAQQHYAEFDADGDEVTTDELLFADHDDDDEEDLDLDEDDDDEDDDVSNNDEDDVIDGGDDASNNDEDDVSDGGDDEDNDEDDDDDQLDVDSDDDDDDDDDEEEEDGTDSDLL